MPPQLLLNSTPVLDKGYVALVDSMNGTHKFQELRDSFGSTTIAKLEKLTSATIIFRCPTWIQLRLSLYPLTIVGVDSRPVEAYIPNPGEIGSPDRLTNESISDDMERTTAAMLINPKSYKADGCDPFVSQVMTPMNVYTTLLVSGTLPQWREFTAKGTVPLPAPIEAYRKAVEQIITVEWPHGTK